MKESTATALHILPTAEPVEQKETALVTIEPTTALAVFTDKEKADAILAKVKKIVAEFKGDVSTAKGRAEIASMAYKVARSKTYVEAERKKLADYHKELPKKIDATGKHFRDEFEKLQDEVRKPLTDWEEAEKARVQGIKDRIAVIQQYVSMAGSAESSEAISDMINNVAAVEVDDHFAEFQTEAQAARDATLVKLYSALDAAMKREAEQAELARLRKEQAKREQEEREAKIAKEAAEKATREAEEKAAREKAESEARELRAKLAQEQAEKAAAQAIADAEAKAKQAVEDERRRKAEEDAVAQFKAATLQADEDNRWRVHSELLEDLESVGCSEAVARELLAALIEGKIRNIEIIY